MKIELGMTVEDKVTNYRGKVTAICTYIGDVDQVLVESITADGVPTQLWCCANRLKLS